ncbi:hypothetical protein FQA39_LY15048 [Lamprigera yunnana]|nr:hypothetical protein FQA39_LY15048 [Lamprigera yunnana]
MEESTQKFKTHYNEGELCNYNYEEPTLISSNSSKISFLKQPMSSVLPKEAVGLSLEVEIADSLKQLITSPENNYSSLIDVTIVRPTDLNCIPIVDNNYSNLNSNEIRNLIASMERQKQEKKKLIDQYKKKLVPVLDKPEPKKRNKRKIQKPNRNVQLKELCIHSAPIAILKPLMSQIKQSLKNLEDRIVEIGDHCPDAIKTSGKMVLSSTSNYTNPSEELVKRKRIRKLKDVNHQRHHHVYTSVNQFDKLRTMLKCQNTDRDPNDDKPCLCQHCGMIGLLIDSQKRPIMPMLPLKPINNLDKQDVESTDTSNGDEQYYAIKELGKKLAGLEERITFQEQTTVTKEYFKRIIKKVINMRDMTSQQNVSSTVKTSSARNCGTQYSFDGSKKTSKKKKVKQRNVQIQQGYSSRYMINPLEIAGNKIHSEVVSSSLDSTGNKAFSTITDCFAKQEEDKNLSEILTTTENYLTCGEETTEPRLDLKTKVMVLVEEKVESPTTIKENHKTVLEKSNEKISNHKVHDMINLMTEKNYNNHIKPTVDAIKKDKKKFKKENAQNNFNMKAEMETAFIKISLDKKSSTEKRNVVSSVAHVIMGEDAKNTAVGVIKPSKLIKSSIPIRLQKIALDNFTSINSKLGVVKKSLIPKLKNDKDTFRAVHFDAVLKNIRKQRIEKEKSSKHVNITYLNPKLSAWDKDSLVSVPVPVSEEEECIDLCSSTSSVRCKTDNDDRRLFKNHSIAETDEDRNIETSLYLCIMICC